MKIIDLEMRHVGGVERIEKQCFSTPWTRQNIIDTLQNGHSIFLAAVLTDEREDESRDNGQMKGCVQNQEGGQIQNACRCQVQDGGQDGGKVAGYISADGVCKTAYINNVAVDSAFRRKGIGSALISALEQRAKAAGCTEITLEVRSKNAAAKNLYQSCGYKKCGERKNYYRDPVDNAEIMTKKL